MNKKNLVVLCYASNTCYTKIVRLNENKQNVRVNIQEGLWSTGSFLINFKIGEEMRYCENDSPGGIIGIYDRTNTKHLNNMNSHSKEATKDVSSALDD